jgi:YVTN family beta-propeller protein
LGVNPTTNLIDVNPSTNRVNVANALDNTVSVIDTSGDTIVMTDPVGPNPHMVAVNPTARRIVATMMGVTTFR